MSLFGYPATVTHYQATVDSWGRVTGFMDDSKDAKVVEEQKLIKNNKGEEITSIAEIHLEGANLVTVHDYFEYVNEFNQTIRYDVLHIEIRKDIGADDVKKVIVYG
jgi:hypothetical protein